MIPLKTIDIMVFIVASDSPKNLKVTSLQLIGAFVNCLRISSLDKFTPGLPKLQTKDSLKKPCSIPK